MKIYNKNDRKIPVPPDAISIMRGSPHGNPYVIGRHGDRAQVCELFEKNALPLMNLEPLRGRNLLCCCIPLQCHGHSIWKKLYGHDYVAD